MGRRTSERKAALRASPAFAGPIRVFATAQGKPEVAPAAAVDIASTGTTCAGSKAGKVINQLKSPAAGLAGCNVPIERVNGKVSTTTLYPGSGRTRPKFAKDADGRFIPQHDDAVSVSQSDGGVPFVGPLPATATGALGAATWDSFVGVVSNRSELGVWGDVQRGDGKPPDGYGTAIAKDPFVFDFTTSGTLDFTFVVGGSWPLSPPPLEPFGPRPSSTFSLFSDSAGGHAHVDFSAGLTGVSLGGTPLDGELFLLSVSATGVLLSPAELEIGFRPWAGLGLTDTDVDTFVAYVRSKLAVLPDGSVGLAPGAEFALVGPGSPIPTLTFSFAAGRVTTSSAAAAEALTVPEPTLALLLVAAGLAAIARRRRTRVVKTF